MIDNMLLEIQILKYELNLNNIDTIVKQFNSIIIEAAHKAIGKTILYSEKTPVLW